MSLTFHLSLLITMTTCHRTLNKIFIRSRDGPLRSEPTGKRPGGALISGIFVLTSLHLPVFHRGNGHLLWHLFDVFGFRCGSHWESGKTFCWFQSIQVTTRWAQPRPHGLHWNFKFKWVSEHRYKRVKCVYLQNPKSSLSIEADKQLYCNFLRAVLACLQLYNAYSQL